MLLLLLQQRLRVVGPACLVLPLAAAAVAAAAVGPVRSAAEGAAPR
jgi:hypothetical protein